MRSDIDPAVATQDYFSQSTRYDDCSPRKAAPVAVVEFQDSTGADLTLDRFRGSFVMLNLWATWCPPCTEEMPSLNRLASRFSAEDLAIVPISIDVSGVRGARQFYKTMGLDKLPIYAASPTNAMAALGVKAIPTTLLINRDGQEIGRLVGPANWDSPLLGEQLLKVIGN